MEGVLRSELPDLGNIAQSLGSKWGFSQKSVQNRYRCIQDVLLSEIDKTPGLGGDKRGKRKKVCRNMKEALQYRDLIADEAPSKRCLEDVDSVEAPPVPKKRALKRSVAAAREFVLNPFVNPIASTSGSYRRTPSHVPPLSQTLMAHPDNAPPLTRLQALSLERGGSTEEEVSDSELFAEGELDEMLRTPEQMKVMMGTYLYQEWEEAQQKAALREAEDAANDALSAGLPDGSGLTVFSDGEGNEPEMVIYPDLYSWNEMRFDDDFELGHDLEDDHPVLYQDQDY
jgi:transcription factor IIIB subunit 2